MSQDRGMGFTAAVARLLSVLCLSFQKKNIYITTFSQNNYFSKHKMKVKFMENSIYLSIDKKDPGSQLLSLRVT